MDIVSDNIIPSLHHSSANTLLKSCREEHSLIYLLIFILLIGLFMVYRKIQQDNEDKVKPSQ